MKQITKMGALLVMITLALFSCKKDENKIYYEGGTAPVLTMTSSATTSSVLLTNELKATTALSLSWTNPSFQFTTGNSSQDVSYQVEIDTTGSNFTSPKKQTVSISKDLGTSFTVDVFNGYLLNQLLLDTAKSHNLEIRIKAMLANGAVSLASNTVKFTTKPYPIPPVVAPPSTNALYIVGDATTGGWNNPVPVPTQQLTRVSSTLYEITLPLIGGKEYLLLPLNGDWGTKYGAIGGNSSNNADGDDFKINGGNLKAPAASGNYKLSIDFQRGKFTATKL